MGDEVQENFTGLTPEKGLASGEPGLWGNRLERGSVRRRWSPAPRKLRGQEISRGSLS